MFEGSAAQFLCIIEALTDTNKRTLITQQPAPDSEVETLDVYAELFMAAQEIICGRLYLHYLTCLCKVYFILSNNERIEKNLPLHFMGMKFKPFF